MFGKQLTIDTQVSSATAAQRNWKPNFSHLSQDGYGNQVAST
ncbi:hypothetical protein [Frondihabitans sucicola]|nr:hypothetical protein [Frondihabitans sucicola]